MTIIEKLHQDLPDLRQQIRRSRVFTSALVAADVNSLASALIADANDDGFYLVHTFGYGPREVDRRGFDLPSEEYKLYSWAAVRRWVSAFLAGASEDSLWLLTKTEEELLAIASSSYAHLLRH